MPRPALRRRLVGWANRVTGLTTRTTRFAHAVSDERSPAWARRARFLSGAEMLERRAFAHPTHLPSGKGVDARDKRGMTEEEEHAQDRHRQNSGAEARGLSAEICRGDCRAREAAPRRRRGAHAVRRQ